MAADEAEDVAARVDADAGEEVEEEDTSHMHYINST